MAKNKKGQKAVISQAMKPIALARELLSGDPNANKTTVRALADKIIDRNKDVKRGQSIKAGTTVNVGKANTTLSKYLGSGATQSFALKDPSLTNKFVGLGKIAATPSDPGSGTSSFSAQVAAVKAANIDTVLFNDETFSNEFIVDLLFESVAGQELLTIARNDTVNGQDVIYQPIKNLNILQDTYNPTRLLAMYDTSDAFFGAFAINLRSKIPSLLASTDGKNYYITENGDLVIELVNMLNDEQVELQIADSGTIEELGI
jgi:hypothetical protein